MREGEGLDSVEETSSYTSALSSPDNNDDSGVITINESDKVEDASLYGDPSSGQGEGERGGFRGGNLAKLVHRRGWGESQRGMVDVMVDIMVADVVSKNLGKGL